MIEATTIEVPKLIYPNVYRTDNFGNYGVGFAADFVPDDLRDLTYTHPFEGAQIANPRTRVAPTVFCKGDDWSFRPSILRDYLEYAKAMAVPGDKLLLGMSAALALRVMDFQPKHPTNGGQRVRKVYVAAILVTASALDDRLRQIEKEHFA